MASALSCIGGMDFDWIEPYSGQLNTCVSGVAYQSASVGSMSKETCHAAMLPLLVDSVVLTPEI